MQAFAVCFLRKEMRMQAKHSMLLHLIVGLLREEIRMRAKHLMRALFENKMLVLNAPTFDLKMQPLCSLFF